MQYNGKKQKSFLQSFTWVAIMLLAMGVAFLGVAVVMQLVPMTPESIHMYSYGVRQPSTEETVSIFRLVFLLTFGIIGLGLTISGSIVAGRERARHVLARRLKEEGACLIVDAVDYSSSAVRMNYRYLVRLRCTYTGPDGITYIFKSGFLRMNPLPYLSEGKVNVYHDRNDMSRYFVDIDGSVGLNTKVVEL